MSLVIDNLVVGPLEVNCSLIYDPASGQALLVDPGDDADFIWQVLTEKKLRLEAILHTHGHFDHIYGSQQISRLAQNPALVIAMHREDEYLWQNQAAQSAKFGIQAENPSVAVSHYLADNEQFAFANHQLKIISTPGHSPGSVCILLETDGQPFLFSGDTLFAGSVGRTDFWRGSHQTLMNSIKNRLWPLDEKTIVIPGHGPRTSIGDEKAYNPYVR